MKGLETLHLVLMMGSFLIFTVSFTLGVLFLVQEFQLKGHRPFPSWLRALPALEIMDSLHYKTLTMGFLCLSLGMISGSILSQKVFGRWMTSDPRVMVSFVTWGIYALFLSVRISAGWRGRRGILLSVLGFATVALAFFGTGHRGI